MGAGSHPRSCWIVGLGCVAGRAPRGRGRVARPGARYATRSPGPRRARVARDAAHTRCSFSREPKASPSWAHLPLPAGTGCWSRRGWGGGAWSALMRVGRATGVLRQAQYGVGRFERRCVWFRSGVPAVCCTQVRGPVTAPLASSVTPIASILSLSTLAPVTASAGEDARRPSNSQSKHALRPIQLTTEHVYQLTL